MTVVATALIVLTAFSGPAQTQQNSSRWSVVRPYNAKLIRMARCESTSRWYIVKHTRTATYYGGLQFDLSTWRSVGGRGYPHRNSILEQKYRAVLLIKRRGYGPWPVCRYA